MRALRSLVASHGLHRLSNPHRIACAFTQCLGVCVGGPLLIVHPEGIWYHHVDETALRHIFDEHLLQNNPVEELIFHQHYPHDQRPEYAPDSRGDGDYEPSELELLAEESAAFAANAGKERQEHDEVRNRPGNIVLLLGDGDSVDLAVAGALLRAWGRNLRVGLLQFNNNLSSSRHSMRGEVQAFQRIGIEYFDVAESWPQARDLIAHGDYDFLVLDGLGNLLTGAEESAQDITCWLAESRPANIHLMITGRSAPSGLREIATEIIEVDRTKANPHRLPGVDY